MSGLKKGDSFKKSSMCNFDPICVEVARTESGDVHVKNTQVPGIIAKFNTDEWSVFIAGVKNGEFDIND